MHLAGTPLLETTVGSAGSSPLDQLLARTAASQSAGANPSPDYSGAVIGTIDGISSGGEPLVRLPGRTDTQSSPARHTCPISAADIGRVAVLVFENADPEKPIVIGLLQSSATQTTSTESPPVSVSLDGQEITLSAKKEIVLRCGKASITLTRAGKVLIRGAYLLSRSSGANRIKGGSVQIN